MDFLRSLSGGKSVQSGEAWEEVGRQSTSRATSPIIFDQVERETTATVQHVTAAPVTRKEIEQIAICSSERTVEIIIQAIREISSRDLTESDQVLVNRVIEVIKQSMSPEISETVERAMEGPLTRLDKIAKELRELMHTNMEVGKAESGAESSVGGTALAVIAPSGDVLSGLRELLEEHQRETSAQLEACMDKKVNKMVIRIAKAVNDRVIEIRDKVIKVTHAPLRCLAAFAIVFPLIITLRSVFAVIDPTLGDFTFLVSTIFACNILSDVNRQIKVLEGAQTLAGKVSQCKKACFK